MNCFSGDHSTHHRTLMIMSADWLSHLLPELVVCSQLLVDLVGESALLTLGLSPARLTLPDHIPQLHQVFIGERQPLLQLFQLTLRFRILFVLRRRLLLRLILQYGPAVTSHSTTHKNAPESISMSQT